VTPPERARRSAVLDLLGAAALWGGMYVVSAATFDQIPPVTLALVRILIGGAVLLIAFRGRVGVGQAPPRRVLAAGGIVALTMVLQFVGTDLTGAAEGALLTTTTPVFVLLFGALLEHQRVRGWAWAGVVVALAGVAILASRSGQLGAAGGPLIGGIPAPLVGDGLLVLSAATWALFSSVGRPLVRSVGAFRAILQASLVAAVLLVPFAGLEMAGRPPPAVDGGTVAAALYLGIGSTALAWSLWYRGYARAPATVSAAAFFVQPLVGATLGLLVLREALGPGFVAGAALIGAGVLAIVAGGREDPSSARAPAPGPAGAGPPR
jgi:drug/metabolite transporter (DMT)-like permease